MDKAALKIAVTGAAGQIAYALLFKIASGEVFGKDQPVILHLIEIPEALERLKGLEMELNDCAFACLKGCRLTSDLAEGFEGVHWALLVGSRPRGAGMERKDLLTLNGKIFIDQGRAIEKAAAADVRILVVGNPCNTNCWIAMKQAPEIPVERWFAMTRLDENRGKHQIAAKLGVPVSDVRRMAIWGNHSSTQYPDAFGVEIKNRPDWTPDETWVQEVFVPTVQKRGAAVIQARGASSAASAAHAIVESIQSIIEPTQEGDFHSLALCTQGAYGTPKDLICSLPVRSDGQRVHIQEGIELNAYGKAQFEASVQELLEEQAAVKALLS